MEEVRIEKLVHGGQGLGTLASGQKIFVWNALPGELVRARITKKKRSYLEGIAEEIVEPSKDRIGPKEENYLATSPWQVMRFEAENRYKKEVVEELFAHEKVLLPDLEPTVHAGQQWQYRNKMEYSFWGDEVGIHLALYKRGSHGKQIVTGSELAMPAIDAAANAIVAQLNTLDVRAGDLKTIVVRCSQEGRAVASLFVKPETFPKLALPKELKGLRVYHSNPRSPASVPTKLLSEMGDILLHDTLLGKPFVYDVDSFFQVNIPVFEMALTRIREHMQTPKLIDMYAGVGSIGLSVAQSEVVLVELDAASAAMAGQNAGVNELNTTVIETSTENALEYIQDDPIIFDPPRAGLHAKIIERLIEEKPSRIAYLSCNPATQARDLALLKDTYDISYFEVFNFFPRTPHIETLAILTRK